MERNKILVLAGSLVVVAATIVIAIVMLRSSGQRPQAAPTAGDDEQAAINAAEKIDPSMIGYHEKGTFPVALHEPRALAVTLEGEIYVGGDQAVQRYSPDGKKLAEIALRGEPRCLAVGGFDHVKRGQLYVGMEDHVEVFDPQGTPLAVWRRPPGPDAIFTSITTTDQDVWIADAANKLVWRFDATGKLLDPPVGEPDPTQHRPGFQVTNHYFDLAAGTDDLVYIVNPRSLHVERYTHSGEYERAWGRGSPAIADFFGCCNPAQLAVFPSTGNFVTAEKGIPRVKVYDRTGLFVTVVAGPEQLSDTPADLAADVRGRVLVLDGRGAKVRVFEKNATKKDDKKEVKKEAKEVKQPDDTKDAKP